jgi:hypothetical protein
MDGNGLSPVQIEELLKPFNHDIVETRKNDEQKVVPHDYVRGRLSEIFGPLGWSEQTLELTEVPSGDTVSPGLRSVAYRARVRLIVHNPDGSTRAFWDGAGAWGQSRSLRGNTPMAIWDLHSDCMNGALSVAFARASKNLGNQFGLCLYTSDSIERPGYRIRQYLTHPAPEELPDDADTGQQEINLGYTEDPDAEHELSSPQSH